MAVSHLVGNGALQHPMDDVERRPQELGLPMDGLADVGTLVEESASRRYPSSALETGDTGTASGPF